MSLKFDVGEDMGGYWLKADTAQTDIHVGATESELRRLLVELYHLVGPEVGGTAPDDRDIDDISAVEECESCHWSPAAIILVDGDWQCYNCGDDPGGRDE